MLGRGITIEGLVPQFSQESECFNDGYQSSDVSLVWT